MPTICRRLPTIPAPLRTILWERVPTMPAIRRRSADDHHRRHPALVNKRLLRLTTMPTMFLTHSRMSVPTAVNWVVGSARTTAERSGCMSSASTHGLTRMKADKATPMECDNSSRSRNDDRDVFSQRKEGPMTEKTATLDEHLDETLRRIRVEFERTGEIHTGFQCVTDAEIFAVPAHWPDSSAKGAACAALRDSFRRRGVNRYLFAGEAWQETPGVHPADDPHRRELALVVAV